MATDHEPDRTPPEVGISTSKSSPPARRPTITDVARLAEVSIGTVSKALNGSGAMRAETRERIARIAAEVGYQPSLLARSLQTGRTFTVGLITGDNFGRLSIPVLLGAEDAFNDLEMSVFLSDSRDDPRREAHYVSVLQARRVDGLIVTGRFTDPRPPLTGPVTVPVVYAMTPSRRQSDISVVPDHTAGGMAAAEYLINAGRRQIAVVTGPRQQQSAPARADGAVKGLRQHRRSPVGGDAWYGDWSEDWGQAAARRLIDEKLDVDAVICGNDQIARGLVDELRWAGRSVPDDVAVIGYDNWDTMVTGHRPHLSTVDPQMSEIGITAARLLLAAIGGRPAPGLHQVPPVLIHRDTT